MAVMHLCDNCGKASAVEKVLICDFCGRDQHHVKRLIAGGRGADICDECTRICMDIVIEKEAEATARATPNTGEAQ
jgi:hypothetical protein